MPKFEIQSRQAQAPSSPHLHLTSQAGTPRRSFRTSSLDRGTLPSFLRSYLTNYGGPILRLQIQRHLSQPPSFILLTTDFSRKQPNLPAKSNTTFHLRPQIGRSHPLRVRASSPAIIYEPMERVLTCLFTPRFRILPTWHALATTRNQTNDLHPNDISLTTT